MKRRVFGLLTVMVMTASFLGGCGKADQGSPVGGTEAPSETLTQAAQETTEAPTEPVSHDGQARSFLTGEWVDEQVAARTPWAVMINNIEDADPQSGIDRAEIMYEAYVESDITRLMMLLQDYDDMDKIGPVRSCREFYVYFAKEFQAIYIHFGFSPLATNLLADSNVQALDGMKGWCDFYRTTDRVAPHNAYTTTEGILGSINSKGWATELAEGVESPLTFNEDDYNEIVFENGVPCTVFKPGFKRNKPEFIYNADDGLYYRNQYGRAHCDMESGVQLSFKNILVKFVTGTKYENGTPILNLEGTGPGYYITNGKLIPVTWEKNSQFGPTKYYYENGEEVIFNQGKTFINIITVDDAGDVKYE